MAIMIDQLMAMDIVTRLALIGISFAVGIVAIFRLNESKIVEGKRFFVDTYLMITLKALIGIMIGIICFLVTFMLLVFHIKPAIVIPAIVFGFILPVSRTKISLRRN